MRQGRKESPQRMCFGGSVPPQATGVQPPAKAVDRTHIRMAPLRTYLCMNSCPSLGEACFWGHELPSISSLPCIQAKHAPLAQKRPQGRDTGAGGMTLVCTGPVHPSCEEHPAWAQGVWVGPHLPREVGRHRLRSVEATVPT